jgi:alcohol dehydrogenase class IV
VTVGFSFKTARKIRFGCGCIDDLVTELRRLNVEHPALITDPGVVNAGIVERVIEVLARGGIQCHVWDAVEPEPSMESGDAAIRFVREGRFDGVLGVGGGSALDTAKATAVALSNPGSLTDWVTTAIEHPSAPLILVPTTAGTGSEVSNVAIFATPHVKHALYSEHLFPDVALVDPLLTVTAPPRLTARTGIDALCHAIEAYVSLEASPITDTLALEAIRLVVAHLRVAYANGDDGAAREGMSLAALTAGLAFGNAGTVLGHAAGYAYVYPATDLHLPHGLAIAVTMPYVLHYNAHAQTTKHATITRLLGGVTTGLTPQKVAARAGCEFTRLLVNLDMPTTLRAVGVARDAIPALAQNVFRSPRHVARNARRVREEEMVKLFTQAYEGHMGESR